MDWYLKVLRNYVGFKGRARRKEFWMFTLVNFILICVLGLIDKMLGWERLFRRLHDTDRSAWRLLLVLIPVLGWLVILIFNCQRGTPGENRFGPDPLRNE